MEEVTNFGKFHLGITDLNDTTKWHTDINAKQFEKIDKLFHDSIINARKFKKQKENVSPKKINVSIPTNNPRRGKSFMFNSPKTPIFE